MANQLSLIRNSDPGLGVEPPLEIRAVDLGKVVSALALAIWNDAETRAELHLQIDCFGPVVADERRLSQLLRRLARHLLSALPEGRPSGTVLRLRSRCHGPTKARIELRTMLKGASSFPSLPALADAPEDPQLLDWSSAASAFGAVLLTEGMPGPLRAVQIEVDLAGQ